MLRGLRSATANKLQCSREHIAPLQTKTDAQGALSQRGTGGNTWHLPTTQRVGVLLQFVLALLQCRFNACVDAALHQCPRSHNALQCCSNTYCRNIEGRCGNTRSATPLRQCCYCRGHCRNAQLYCSNIPIFSRSSVLFSLMKERENNSFGVI